MFSRAERLDHGYRGHGGLFSAVASRGNEFSVVGAGLTVAGDLWSAGEIQIFGAVHGEINCRSVIVAAGGHVEGWIYASTVYIFGSVYGRIEATEVTVGDTATVYGDIYHHILSVDPNAVLEGLRPWRPRSHLAERRPWYPGD